MATDLAPIVHTYTLRCSAARAFAVYTDQIGAWWDPRYTPDAAEYLKWLRAGVSAF